MNYRATYIVLADVGVDIFFFRIPISLLLFLYGNDHLLIIWVYQSSGRCPHCDCINLSTSFFLSLLWLPDEYVLLLDDMITHTMLNS